jgi:hypothetical protein
VFLSYGGVYDTEGSTYGRVQYLMSHFGRCLDKGVADKWGRLEKQGFEHRIQHCLGRCCIVDSMRVFLFRIQLYANI